MGITDLETELVSVTSENEGEELVYVVHVGEHFVVFRHRLLHIVEFHLGLCVFMLYACVHMCVIM